ncbi:MAG TPA: hypothetical protein VG498_01145, partial [Terriglobales bacterium]|nr:hypothetical protein [Terriglobales bacterium]
SRLFYGPGFTYSSEIRSFNSTSQAAGADIEYRFTKHLSMQLRDAFSLTRNPYDNWAASSELPNLGVLNRPNASAFASNTRNLTEQFQGELVCQLARHTQVGVGGTFSQLDYRTLAEGITKSTNSIESRIWSGNAFYGHQFSPHYSWAIQYTASNLSSQGTQGQFFTLSHRVLGFFTISFSTKVQLSVFGGPQQSAFDDTPIGSPFGVVHSSKMSASGGSTFTWEGEHSALSASFVQQVTDSGLNGGGALLARTANVQIHRRLASTLTFNVFGTYVGNNQLDPFSSVFLTDSASVGLGFTKVLTPHLTLSMSALRQQFMQTTGVIANGFPQRSHELGMISLSYSFSRPIGR